MTCATAEGERTFHIRSCSTTRVGTKTVPCTATRRFEDEEGNTVVIEITDAQIHLTPAR